MEGAMGSLSTVQYSTVQYSTVQYSALTLNSRHAARTVLYCTVLYWGVTAAALHIHKLYGFRQVFIVYMQFLQILDFFYKIGLNRLYKALNLIKMLKTNPLTTYLNEGLISQKRFFDIRKYFAYKPYFNHVTRYFRCIF